MEVQEIVSRLRLVSLALVGIPSADRETKLRREISSIMSQVPRSEQPALLARLGNSFPVWPPDVPPPEPLTDSEMIDRLRMRTDHGDEDKRRIHGMLRESELSCGLTPDDIQKIRAKVTLDPNLEPVVGRVVDALLVSLQTLADIDRVFRLFLQSNELGVWGLQIPRFRETIVQLLTRSDTDQARHGDLERLNNACGLLSRVATMLVQWPQGYVGKLAEQYAPSRIEAGMPKKLMGGLNYEAVWNEYVRRLGGNKDEEGCKAEFLELFKRILNETASS